MGGFKTEQNETQAAITAVAALLPNDEHSGGLINVDYQSAAVHVGKTFCACYRDNSVASAATVTLRMVAPATKHMHVFLEINGIFETSWDFYEDTTHGAGTGVTAQNRERNSAETATLVVTHTVSGGNDGTMLTGGGFRVREIRRKRKRRDRLGAGAWKDLPSESHLS